MSWSSATASGGGCDLDRAFKVLLDRVARPLEGAASASAAASAAASWASFALAAAVRDRERVLVGADAEVSAPGLVPAPLAPTSLLSCASLATVVAAAAAPSGEMALLAAPFGAGDILSRHAASSLEGASRLFPCQPPVSKAPPTDLRLLRRSRRALRAASASTTSSAPAPAPASVPKANSGLLDMAADASSQASPCASPPASVPTPTGASSSEIVFRRADLPLGAAAAALVSSTCCGISRTRGDLPPAMLICKRS
mmetsp:Transcript_14241/g.59604  ORF Transcript_14241/g.59604 Transcript_14241/m.59604 type:complete len:256 (+) Transcript_14241:800-1567(+)